MFTAHELTEMRAVQERAMPETVTIERRNLSSDGFGGVVDGARSTVASNVPARITQAQVQVMYGQVARDLQVEKWTIRVPYGTDLQDEDFVIWGSTVFQVEDVKSRGWMTTVSASAEVLK